VLKEEYPDFIQSLVKWSYNALKNSGSMWLVSGWNNLRVVLDAVEDVGFIQLNHCIWKYQFGVYTERRFTTSHYHMILLVKDEECHVFNKPEHYAEDVWNIKRPYHHGEKTAGNELPDELVERCIKTSSNKGDLVVDPCLGSGTTMNACLKTGRRCIGIEINPSLEVRIKQKLGLNLFASPPYSLQPQKGPFEKEGNRGSVEDICLRKTNLDNNAVWVFEDCTLWSRGGKFNTRIL